MTIRNTKLGGNDFSDGEILYDYDLDDTNDTVISLNKIDYSSIRTNGGLGSSLNISEYIVDFSSLTNADTVDMWKYAYKPNINTTYNIESVDFDTHGVNFSQGLFAYNITPLKTGDGTSDILDNFDNSTVGSHWTQSTTDPGTNDVDIVESDGNVLLRAQSSNSNVGDLEASITSGDIKNTNRTLIIPFLMSRVSNTNNNRAVEINIKGTSQSTVTLIETATGDRSDRKEGYLKITISNNTVRWESVVERIITETDGEISRQFKTEVNTGTLDITSYSDLFLEFVAKGLANSSNSISSYLTLYGVFEELESLTNQPVIEMSNDGGVTYDEVSESGFVSFSNSDSHIQAKVSGNMASDETFIFTAGGFKKL